MKEDVNKEIVLDEGVSVQLEGNVLTIKGLKGEIKRDFIHPKVEIVVEGNKILLKSLKATRRDKAVIGSFVAHIKNMVKGVQEHHYYKLKICSGHFPMNVAVSGKDLIIKNFLGEAVPRKVAVIEGVDIKVNGDMIEVSGPDKEATGQMAARIENICRITNRDRRIFQDGCYMVHKAGKDIV